MNRRQRRAKRHASSNPSAVALLQAGIEQQQAGHLAEAEACYRRAIAAEPGHAEAFLNLGDVLRAQGKLDEAVAAYRQAILLNPHFAEAYNDIGNVLRSLGKLGEAEAAYRQALVLKPDYPHACYNLGSILKDTNKLEEAVAAYRDAIRARPDLAEAHTNLGIVLRAQGKVDEAVDAHREAIRIKPDYAKAYTNLGNALHDQGKLDNAVAASRQAIALDPNLADAHNNLGLALMALGHLSEASAALEQAIRLAPRTVKYRRNLGEIKPFAAGDAHLAEMEQLARDGALLSADDWVELHFGLGKAYEDQGRHADAFLQWLHGTALKRRQIAYDEAATLGVLDRAEALFTSELNSTWQNVGEPSSVPVFIVGMPRSGSTLVEQILASHPQVCGGGELTYFGKAVKMTFGGSASFPELVSGMTDKDVRALGARYLAEITPLAPTATHITDKMPSNFVLAGLIHLALPNAPIIHTIRDPVDTCLSCFSKLFARGQDYTYDLAELGRYYCRYLALMAHWRRVLPAGRILDVRYEDVVCDLEGQARRIIAHCGLDWDPRCLAFHQTQRPVRTASATQVRQPIYGSSVGRWRAYAPFIGPLLAELGVVTADRGDGMPLSA
jgi:tetratricopeptide (TPR) repeat protein